MHEKRSEKKFVSLWPIGWVRSRIPAEIVRAGIDDSWKDPTPTNFMSHVR